MYRLFDLPLLRSPHLGISAINEVEDVAYGFLNQRDVRQLLNVERLLGTFVSGFDLDIGHHENPLLYHFR